MNDDYTLVPMEFLTKPGLSGLERWIVILCKRYGDNITMEFLYSKLTDAPGAIRRAVKNLQEAGYLVRDKHHVNGRYKYTYKASWTPIK